MDKKPVRFKLIKPNLDDYVVLPNPGLRSYFRHVDLGQGDDYRTPFAGGAPRSRVLSEWDTIFEGLNVKATFPGLYDYEIEMRDKVGPLSVQKPLQDRLDDVESYWDSINPEAMPIDSDAIQAAARKLCRHGHSQRLRSVENTVKQMRLDTNSGLPLFTKRRDVTDEAQFMARHMGLAYARSSNGTVFSNSAVLGWRGQEHGPEPKDVKQRVVWMFPFHVNISELRAYQTLVEMCQHELSVPAYVSMDEVDQEVTALFDSKEPDDLVMCTDFTAFDQHFGPRMQDAAKQVLSWMLTDNDDTQWWMSIVFPIKYTLPLLLDESTLAMGSDGYRTLHGMGSGSGGTNFDEVCAHTALQMEASMRNGRIRLNRHSMAYGDDGILSFPYLNAQQVIDSYTRHGLEMNPEKQMLSTHDCVFLRRWHSVNYRRNGTMVGVYSTFRALGRLLGQERFYDPEKWNRNMVEIRYLSILENCKWSPYFHQFVDWCTTKDKYRLGLDLPGFLTDIDRHADEATRAFGTDFLGYTRSLQRDQQLTGMSNWDVVKYLKSKL